jgi:hypothetical protein
VLSRADWRTIARYVQMLSRWKVLTAAPECGVRTLTELGSLMLRHEQEFGLTPASRTRVQAVPKHEAVGKSAKFFGGKQA